MHLYDVEDAIDRADAHGVQRAFRVLIAFPKHGHIEGARSPAKLADLFDQVTASLQLDQTALPQPVCQAMEEVTSVSFGPNVTYAHGAIVAYQFRERWGSIFVDAVASP